MPGIHNVHNIQLFTITAAFLVLKLLKCLKNLAYLDLNIFNRHGQIEMEIYRKPTTTDITINNKSCHPKEQKLPAYKNWIHRLLTLPLEENAKNKN